MSLIEQPVPKLDQTLLTEAIDHIEDMATDGPVVFGYDEVSGLCESALHDQIARTGGFMVHLGEVWGASWRADGIIRQLGSCLGNVTLQVNTTDPEQVSLFLRPFDATQDLSRNDF